MSKRYFTLDHKTIIYTNGHKEECANRWAAKKRIVELSKEFGLSYWINIKAKTQTQIKVKV